MEVFLVLSSMCCLESRVQPLLCQFWMDGAYKTTLLAFHNCIATPRRASNGNSKVTKETFADDCRVEAVLFAMQFIKTLPVSIFIVLLGIIPMNHLLDRDISIARIGFRPFYWNTTGPPRPSRHVTEEQGSETFDRNCSYFMECDGEVIYYDYKNANPGVGCSGSWASNGFERHCLNFMIANLPNSFDWWLCTGGSDPFHDAHFESCRGPF